MAYGASGLKLLVPGLGSGPSIWYYTSTDAHGTVEGSLYFTDSGTAGKFKMKVGDIVFVVDSDTGPGNTTIHSVTVVTSVGATISAALLA